MDVWHGRLDAVRSVQWLSLSGRNGGDERRGSDLGSGLTGSSERAGRDAGGEPSLSVVIPTLNEADRIATCLDSVFRTCEGRPSFEVILVDSHSDDGTVDIAREYPITVLRLPSDEPVTPGAGRRVGAKAASGDHVLFVDGDMELADGWLDDARRLLHERDRVAGVGGQLSRSDREAVETVKTLHGVMLYDAAVLEQVGGFDPFLQGYEDIELGFRIRAAGYELVELPDVVATHSRPHDVSELRRRWQNGYLFGFGQALRKSVRSPRIVKDLVLRKWFQVAFFGWFTLGLVVALLFPAALLGWLALTGVLYVAGVLYEGPVSATMRFLWQGVAWTGYLRGFVNGSRDPSEYPADAATVVSVPEPEEARPGGSGATADGGVEHGRD